MNLKYCSLAALVLLSPTRSGAQEKTNEPIGVNDAVQPSDRIGRYDLIAVTVYDSPDLSRRVRVGDDGSIRLPLLSQPVTAAGLTTEQLEKALAGAFRDEQILVDPSISVAVLQNTSKPVSVAGAVRHPVTFDAAGDLRLLGAITRAEGLTAEAGPDIIVSIAASNGGKPVTRTIAVRDLMDGGHPELNLELHGGEEIRIPEAPKVFVIGNIRKPGSYSVQDTADMTVLKVLALAGGSLPYTQKQAYIYRHAPDGKGGSEIPVNLQAMLDRKSPDIPVKPNDLLYVLDNKSRRLTMGALDRLAGFGASTAAGVVIWRH